MKKRDNTIDKILEYYGLSVIINNEEEYKHIQNFLSDTVLYIDYSPKMSEIETGIIIWSSLEDYSTGSVGMANRQREKFIRTVKFNDFFKL